MVSGIAVCCLHTVKWLQVNDQILNPSTTSRRWHKVILSLKTRVCPILPIANIRHEFMPFPRASTRSETHTSKICSLSLSLSLSLTLPHTHTHRGINTYRQVGFYGISTIGGYSSSLYVHSRYIYMICKHILWITFLNKLDLFFAHN